MFNLHGTEKEREDEESSEEESDDDEEEKKPQMELAMMPHYGGINRVRVCLVPSSKQALMSCCLGVPISMFLCGIPGDPAWRSVVGCRVVGERTGRNI